MIQSFSPGVDNVITCLMPWDRCVGEAFFPSEWKPGGGKFETSDTAHTWFQRCVDKDLSGNIDRCKIEENIALFAGIKWKNNTEITYANCQVLIVIGGDLDAFYCGEPLECQYLRLDFDPNCLGAIFKESIPHVHCKGNGEPRFHIDSLSTGNVLIDFLDFVYRNYGHDQWVDWARNNWDMELRRMGLSDDPFEAIIEAFKSSKSDILCCKYNTHIEAMKRCWRDSKDKLYPLRVQMAMLNLLSYNL